MRTKMFVNAIPSPTKEQPSTIVFRGRTRYQTPISTSGNDMQMTDVIVDVPIQSRVLHSEHRWRRIELPTFHGSTIALHTGQRSRNWLMTYFRPSNCRRGAIGEEYGFTSAMIQCTNASDNRVRAKDSAIKCRHFEHFGSSPCSRFLICWEANPKTKCDFMVSAGITVILNIVTNSLDGYINGVTPILNMYFPID